MPLAQIVFILRFSLRFFFRLAASSRRTYSARDSFFLRTVNSSLHFELFYAKIVPTAEADKAVYCRDHRVCAGYGVGASEHGLVVQHALLAKLLGSDVLDKTSDIPDIFFERSRAPFFLSQVYLEPTQVIGTYLSFFINQSSS